MRKLIKTLSFLFLLPCAVSADDAGSWISAKFNFNPTQNIYLSTLLEHRTENHFKSTDCYFARQYGGYKWCSWLKTDAAYEILKNSESVQNKGLFSATATLKQGNFSFSFRERYVYTYTVKDKSSDHVLRSKATVTYNIPETRFSPYVACEVYAWDGWQKTRHYIGTNIDIDKRNSLNIFYLYYTKANNAPQQHILGVYYVLDL